MSDKMNIIVDNDEMDGFLPYQKAVLICSKRKLNDKEKQYLELLFDSCHMDWSAFLGTVLINRVNGIVYKKIREFANVPKYVKYFLEISYNEQIIRSKIHQNEIKVIAGELEKNNIKYAFLKGAVLNTYYYELGDRISNDTDILVDSRDVTLISDILKRNNYVQGEVRNGILKAATQKEILFAKLNTYELVPFNKHIDDKHLPYHEIDINFRLSNDEKQDYAKIMLDDTCLLDNGEMKIRTLSLEKFLIFLCIHHYREATMIYKIASGNDLLLYKFMDVHFFVTQKESDLDWQRLYNIASEIRRIDDVYYTLYYTECLFPKTLRREVLEYLKPKDISYLDEYKGKDNSNEVFKWKMDFSHRFFSNNRRIEAWQNIRDENERFRKIKASLEES